MVQPPDEPKDALHRYTAARLHGCMAARLQGYMAARIHVCMAARLHGRVAAWPRGLMAAWPRGRVAAWLPFRARSIDRCRLPRGKRKGTMGRRCLAGLCLRKGKRAEKSEQNRVI